jgi:hypothetical protein
MINLDDVEDGIRELERAVRLGLSGAMITEYPLEHRRSLSLCDMIFSGVSERHPRLTLTIVEFELAWAPHMLSTMDYTYRERHGEAIYRFKGGMLPSDFFHRNVVPSFQEDASRTFPALWRPWLPAPPSSDWPGRSF